MQQLAGGSLRAAHSQQPLRLRDASGSGRASVSRGRLAPPTLCQAARQGAGVLTSKAQALRLLELGLDADEAAIKKAYRRLALRLHPDVTHTKGTEARFLEVQEAYHLLIDRLRDADPEAERMERRLERMGKDATVHRSQVPQEEARSRVKSQLGCLADRAAQRKQRAAEAEHRAAVRAHTHGVGQAQRASTGDAHERIREQLDELAALRAEEAAAAAAAAAEAAANGAGSRSAQLLIASTSAAATPARPADDVELEIGRLVRLSKLAREWRAYRGIERVEPSMGWNFAETKPGSEEEADTEPEQPEASAAAAAAAAPAEAVVPPALAPPPAPAPAPQHRHATGGDGAEEMPQARPHAAGGQAVQQGRAGEAAAAGNGRA